MKKSKANSGPKKYLDWVFNSMFGNSDVFESSISYHHPIHQSSIIITLLVIITIIDQNHHRPARHHDHEQSKSLRWSSWWWRRWAINQKGTSSKSDFFGSSASLWFPGFNERMSYLTVPIIIIIIIIVINYSHVNMHHPNHHLQYHRC